LKRSRDLREAADKDSARAIAATFAETPLVVVAKAGATGKLFGSVTANDLVAAVEQQFHVVIDRKHVAIPAPIRDLGTHQVTVTLYADVRGTLTVDVRSA
jgi:large subunit ribosomal protein L9